MKRALFEGVQRSGEWEGQSKVLRVRCLKGWVNDLKDPSHRSSSWGVSLLFSGKPGDELNTEVENGPTSRWLGIIDNSTPFCSQSSWFGQRAVSLYKTVAQLIKNLPAMWETQVPSLGLEDHLEKGMATYWSIFAWRIPWTEEPGGLQSIGSQRVGYNWSDSAPTHTDKWY